MKVPLIMFFSPNISWLFSHNYPSEQTLGSFHKVVIRSTIVFGFPVIVMEPDD